MKRYRHLIINIFDKEGVFASFLLPAKERFYMKKEIFKIVLYALIYTFGKKKAGDIFDKLLLLIKNNS